jgi:hypothetical protein
MGVIPPHHRGVSASKKGGLATPSLSSYRNVAIVTPSPPLNLQSRHVGKDCRGRCIGIEAGDGVSQSDSIVALALYAGMDVSERGTGHQLDPHCRESS